MENNSHNKHEKLDFIIKEEIGPCMIDPSFINKLTADTEKRIAEYSVTSFPTNIYAEFLAYEDFEPYEACIEDFEEFIPYNIEDD